MTLEPPDVIDTNLDLGPGETWLRPAPAALAGVAAILIKRGIAEARAPEVAMQLAKLAGRRFQDDLAIGQTPDRQASLWLLNALEHVEALLAVLQTGPKANSPNATTAEHETHQMEDWATGAAPGNGRLAEIVRRASDQRRRDEGDPNLTDVADDLATLQRTLSVALAAVMAPPAEMTEAELSIYGLAGPLSLVQRAQKDFLLTLLPNTSDRVGRPPTSDPLVDLVYRAARTWRAEFGKRPGRTRSPSGTLVGPFPDMLAQLAAAYTWFPSGRLGDTAIAAGLARMIEEEKPR